MIKRKTAECIECGNTRLIYSKKMCGYCYQNQRKKNPLPRPKKQIAKFSRRLSSNLKEYRKVRDEFLLENPICMYPECNSREVTLHHAKGRIGNLLTDKRFFKSLCWPHHQYIENNPDLARKLGLSFYRL